MLQTEIKALVDLVKSDISHFDNNGFYYDPYTERSDGFKGVTDTMDSYFFIQPKPNSQPNEYPAEQLGGQEGLPGEYLFSTDLLLVAGIKKINRLNAVTALVSTIDKFSSTGILINHVSTNSTNIYKALYQKEYSLQNDLILIDFTMQKMVPQLHRCDIDLCDEGC